MMDYYELKRAISKLKMDYVSNMETAKLYFAEQKGKTRSEGKQYRSLGMKWMNKARAKSRLLVKLETEFALLNEPSEETTFDGLINQAMGFKVQ